MSDTPALSRRRFTTRRRVEFRDTDAAGIAHFSTYFVWMESAEHELLRAAGVHLVEQVAPATPGAVAETVSWPRVNATCDYRSAVRFNDELDIDVGVERVGGASVTWAFRFACAGRLVAVGRVVAVRCRLRAGEPPVAVQIPPEIRGRLEEYRIDPDAERGSAPHDARTRDHR